MLIRALIVGSYLFLELLEVFLRVVFFFLVRLSEYIFHNIVRVLYNFLRESWLKVMLLPETYLIKTAPEAEHWKMQKQCISRGHLLRLQLGIIFCKN